MSEQDHSPGDSLKYVCDMIEQLKVVAGGSGGPFLIYLLDMASAEANERLRAMTARSTSRQ